MRVQAYFHLLNKYESFPVEEVTKVLNLLPTFVNERQEMPLYTSIFCNFTNWQYGKEYNEFHNINDLLISLVEVLEPKMNLIKQLINKYKLTAEIAIVMGIDEGRMLSLMIDSRVCNFAAEINAGINIYSYEFESLIDSSLYLLN
ncbi:DUF4279 domain-containing protein [Metasolibacillus sp. FSL H7-0170]|uniref:DUF4279 domain-containing protein n=1 Tax=Metasolibacillus TaxID=2703677 RepID=UPI000793996D|nr:DUF4279 domain-containing protein [Metasolibacillus fluoroglycofenilyticus]KYG90925.1 hypothetical protein A0U40_17350 [[Bacillus] sp. KCTC 13219]